MSHALGGHQTHACILNFITISFSNEVKNKLNEKEKHMKKKKIEMNEEKQGKHLKE